jgi:hypothetical protein
VANLPAVLQATFQSLENKWDELKALKALIFYQPDIKNGKISCFTESWMNDDIKNIELVGYTLYRQDRTAKTDSGKHLCKQLVHGI